MTFSFSGNVFKEDPEISVTSDALAIVLRSPPLAKCLTMHWFLVVEASAETRCSIHEPQFTVSRVEPYELRYRQTTFEIHYIARHSFFLPTKTPQL